MTWTLLKMIDNLQTLNTKPINIKKSLYPLLPYFLSQKPLFFIFTTNIPNNKPKKLD